MLFRSNDTATTEIYTQFDTLSLHDALPMLPSRIISTANFTTPEIRACFASGGYNGCTRWMRSPSIIRETRGAWRVVGSAKAKLETEFAIELTIGFWLQ